MNAPRSCGVAQFAIYSRSDGVADWSSCMEEDAPFNTEFTCSRLGMVFNHTVHRAVATRLAEHIQRT